MSSKKYRPYFTLAELKEITSALRHYPAADFGKLTPVDLIRYLDRFVLDIESGLRQANHTLKPTVSESLELDDSPKDTGANPQTLFLAWQANASLSVREILIVDNYRYTNDLMTPQEETEYEKRNGILF